MTQSSQVPHGIIVRAARVVPASPEEVYRLLTDPSADDEAGGVRRRSPRCSTVTWTCIPVVAFASGIRSQKGNEDVVSGSYLEAVPPSKLAFTLVFGEAGDGIVDTRVTVDLCDLKDGTTRAVITHEGLPSPHAATVHSAGWHNMLQDMSLHVVGEVERPPRSALDAQHLLQRVHHLHEVGLRRHHRVDVLVGHRRLVDHARVLAALDAGG